MKVLKGECVKKIDKLCYSEYKIPTLLLMEHAGISIAEEIEKEFSFERKILIVCGKGNNGGDGFVLARILHNKGYNVKVLVTHNEYQGDSKINLDIITSLNISLVFNLHSIEDLLNWCDIVVDAIFGVGYKGILDKTYKFLIEKINISKKHVISVDIPSGLEASGAGSNNTIVKSNKTITLALPKENLLIGIGREKRGELVVKDIGIPKKLIEEYPVDTFWIRENMAKKLLPQRKMDSHKGTFGSVLIVGGSLGMSGAVMLAIKSALRSGIGLVYAVVDKELVDIVENNCHEAITIPLPDTKDQLKSVLKKSNVLLFGPGLSLNKRRELFLNFVKNYKGQVVIDGDGINLLAQTQSFSYLNESWVLTPHPKEMSRLTGLCVDAILKDPINIARKFSIKYNCTTILKGSTTSIATPEGEVYLNITGNNGLSTGGSGDVLAGIIVSLIAQGLSCQDAAKLGVYLHGKTADIIAKEKGYYSLLPSDIPNYLHQGFKSILQ